MIGTNMNTMQDYTIYCTEEQTKKAFELGVLLEEFCGIQPTISIDGILYDIPTAEQMIGWLEEQMDITTFHINHYTACENDGYGYLIISKESVLECDAENEGMYLYSSRQEATLAAIDAALEYLSNGK